MKKQGPNNWIDEFIFDEKLSDESIYAIYSFLEELLMHFEGRAFHKLRNYAQKQKKINRCLYEFSPNEDPF
jgi:hypothetical protein